MNIRKRTRKRTLSSGATVLQTRWVLSYNKSVPGRLRPRRQKFFKTQKEAQLERNRIIAEIEAGTYSSNRNRSLSIREIVRRWEESRAGEVKEGTLEGYRRATANIVGPLLLGTAQQRTRFKLTGKVPEGAKTVPLLGDVRVQDLTTSDIRSWHKTLVTSVGSYSANRAKMFLVAVLAMAAEDLNIRPPVMPRNLGRGKPKAKKALLTTEQISKVVQNALHDRERGLYVAFPFLAGTRPSEQLGLLWEDVDFEANVIHIRRMQERDGSITNLTKTAAGTRDAGTAGQLGWTAVAAGVGIGIGLALHRMVALLPAGAVGIRWQDIAGALLAGGLAMLACPWPLAALAHRGYWLAALVWPVALLAGFALVRGLP